VGEVSVHFPGFSKIVRPLHKQGSRSEGLEAHDKMGKMELRFQVQLDVHVLHSILSLPPPGFPVLKKRGHNVLHPVAIGGISVVGLSRVAHKAFLLIFKMAHDTESLRTPKTAG
jgi:hypothetical protein